jgi:GTPase involved in cell partitioning and DNA repair
VPGKGLGDRFLKHVERTRLLLHLVDCGDLPMAPPVEAWRVIRSELAGHSAELAERPTLVVATKVEDDAAAHAPGTRHRIGASRAGHLECHRAGLRELVAAVWSTLSRLPRQPVG